MAERQFGPYRLVRQVAVGGMAEIHLAKAKGIAGFEKYVALKMIHPNFAEDEAFIQMLIDEAKIAVQLQHVNIAQTFDLGRVGDQYYITMEYVDGSDLYKILRRGSEQDLDVPLDVCAFVAKEVATGLDYAHRKKDMAGSPLGIVHRDVSPQNVLVSHAGEVKIVDFGIAKATMKVRQTAAGVIKGKYYYMSPEQAWGDKLDHRSDIFSAGIVLYEMMTGQMLYLEEDLHRLLDMVRKADIAPPSTLRRDVPPQLERITMHALAKVAGERYQHAADMANDLERFLHSYSPVFTAAKLARHLRAVMGDPLPIQTAPEPSVDPVIQTLEIGDEELVHDRTDLRGDENSVIFRLDGLKPGADRAGAAGGNRAAAPGPAVPRSLGGPQPGSGKIPSIAPVAGRAPAPAVAGRAPTPQPAPQVPSAPARPGPLRPPPGQKMELPRITQRKPGGTQPPPITVPPKPIVGPQSGATTAPLPAPTTDSLGVPVPSPQQPTKPARPPSRPPGVPRNPLEQTRPVDARMLAASTWAMEDNDEDLDGIGERTMITEPPGFDAGSTSAPTDDVGYEPTMIEQGWSSSSTTSVPDPDTADDEDDAPTLAPSESDGSEATTIGHHDDDEDGPTMTRNEAVRRAGPAPVPAQPTVPVRKPRSPANPALAASTPTPAVSEVRKPQRSRRTPAGGVPGGPGGSVLQAMINAAGSEPMPTRVAPGRGGPSDGVPPLARDGGSGPMAQPHGAMPQPPPQQPPQPPHYQQQPPPQHHPQQPPQGPAQGQGYPQNQPPQPYDSLYPIYPQNQQPPQQGSYPGQHAVPVNMPPHLQPYGWPAQAPYTPQPGAGGQGLPPGIANQAGPYPFQPYQQGQPQNMPTFTQQMRAVIELDEIPSQYKVGHGGPRWFVLALAALIAVAGAAVVTYFLLRRNTEAKVTAVLLIDSVPGGGTVVIDNEQLPHPTPVPYSKTAPGQRHHIKISAAGHRTYEDDIVVPTSGGEYRISPVLQAITGKIHVETVPPGADVFIKGDNRGRTPVDLVDIEIGSTVELELRHKDFGTRTVPLKWPESGEIRLDIDLKK